MNDDKPTMPAYFLSIARERVNAEIRNGRFWGELERRHHYEHAPVPEAEQQAQREWIVRFNAAMEEGEANDWIEYDYDTDPCAAEIVTQKSTKVFDETADDHVARVRPYVDSLRREE